MPDGITEIKMIIHADDTALFTESVMSLSRFLKSISVSRLFLERQLAETNVRVTFKQGSRVLNEFEELGVRQADSVKSCGVWFGAAAQEKNEKREKVKTYEQRNLNIYKRTTIISTVLMAKIWYVASVFGFSKSFYKEVDKIVYKFLWRTTEWLARNVLINSRSNGGLGVVHPQAKVKAIRVMQVIQVLKDPDKASSVLAR